MRHSHLLRFILLLVFANVLQVTAQELPCQFRIGLIADPQYADLEDRGARLYRRSLQKIEECVHELNNQAVDFTFVLGDLVDQGINDLPRIAERLAKLDSPTFKLLGNHDYVHTEDGKNLYKAFDMPASYYSVNKGDWVFILLNTNEVSQYATEVDTYERIYWQRQQDSLKRQGRTNAALWNGGVGPQQFAWLKGQLDEAQNANKHILVLTHHPLFPENGLEALNNRELLELIAQFPNVRAVLSGHHHAGNFGVYKGIPMVTLEGMVEGRDNAFGVLNYFIDRIEIHGKGRLTSRVLWFPRKADRKK